MTILVISRLNTPVSTFYREPDDPPPPPPGYHGHSAASVTKRIVFTQIFSAAAFINKLVRTICPSRAFINPFIALECSILVSK